MQAGTARAHEKPEHPEIKFLGFTLKGYTVKKLVFHAVIGIATALGALHQGLIHTRQTELERREVELAAREAECEKNLNNVLRMLQGTQPLPSTRTAGIGGNSQNEEWRKILNLPQPSIPADIVRDLQAGWQESKKRDAKTR